MKWTPAMDAALRAGWADRSNAELAAALGVTPNAAKCRGYVLGLPARRQRWTAAEDARLRELYPDHTAAACATLLGRTAKSVHQQAKKLGLAKQPHHPPEVIERARALNAAGLPDRVVAERMADVFGTGPEALHRAKHLRQRFGWPRHPDVAAKRAAVERQRRTLGVRTSGELRAMGYRRYATRCGWPDDLPPRAVQILNVLAARGPKTAAELAAAIGTRTRRNVVHGGPIHLACSNNSALCRGHGTYTGLLMARGLVAAIRRSGGPGSGRHSARLGDLYTLTPHAVRVRQEILDGNAATAGEKEQDGDAGRGRPADPAAGRDRRVR